VSIYENSVRTLSFIESRGSLQSERVTMANNTQNYCISGPCPLSRIGLVTRLALFNWSNRVCVSLRSPENENRSSFRNVVFSSILNSGRWAKSRNPKIQGFIVVNSTLSHFNSVYIFETYIPRILFAIILTSKLIFPKLFHPLRFSGQKFISYFELSGVCCVFSCGLRQLKENSPINLPKELCCRI
jgi:hypothetical protein